MPEEAHEIRISDPADMTGLEDFFPSHDKAGHGDLTLEEAAKRLNLSERTVQRRLKRGQLTGYKVNGDRGPEWRIILEASLDTTLTAVPTSDDTTVMTDAETVSSEDMTTGVTSANMATFDHLATFYQDQIEHLQEKLEAATYRNGYLVAQLASVESQVKLLPDLSAKAIQAEVLEQKVLALEAELSSHKKSMFAKFSSWFLGKQSASE